MKAKSKKVLAYLEEVFSQYEHNEAALLAANQKLDSNIQQLKASEQQLVAANLQLDAMNQQLMASEQHLKTSNQQLDAMNQQLLANEQHLKASNQQLDAMNQQLMASETQLRTANEKLTIQTRELLRLAAVVANSRDAIIIRDLKGNITAWNAGAEIMYGYGEAEALKMHWIDLVHEDYEKLATDIIDRLKNHEQLESFETKRVTKDGTILDVWIVVTGLFDENEQLIGAVSTERDITQSKRMERELMQYHEQLEKLVDERSAALKSEIAMRKLTEVELKAANQQLHAANQQLHASNQQLHDYAKQIENQNAQLTEANIKATESDRLKSAFLANMSHEIRTPMNGILGFADLLREPDIQSENQQLYLDIIEKSGIRMLNILNDIMDISRIESGQMAVSLAPVNISHVLEDCLHFFKPEASKKHIELKLSVASASDALEIITDRDKLFGILSNLIKNAIKYTEVGSIEIGYDVHQPQNKVTFYVKDTGIGIPQNRQTAIFDRFVQADIEDKMARQGAGLGLSISKAYAEMLHGELWVESEVNAGSSFYCSLPITEMNNEPSWLSDTDTQLKNEPLDKSIKVLIVDDDPASQQLLGVYMTAMASEILTASTGTAAVELCKKNPDIDLILMDIQMPHTNGYQATRQIRKFNKTIVIIAQTAFALSGDREKSLAAGCNDYITKPIKKAELETVLLRNLKTQ